MGTVAAVGLGFVALCGLVAWWLAAGGGPGNSARATTENTPPDQSTAGSLSQTTATDEAAAQAKHAADVERRRAEYAAASPGQREQGVRNCVAAPQCSKADVDLIISTGKTENERARLTAVSAGESARRIAQAANDGTELNGGAIATIAAIVVQEGIKPLDTMPTASFAEAKKDTDAARGKVIRVTGNVAEIRREGQLFTGGILLDSGGFVRFFTPLPTDGIVDGSWCAFRGVFVQEYDYANVSGGQTKSLLLVGAFNK